MIKEITKKVDALPPLPKTLIELQEFKKQLVQEVHQLLSILDKDPLIMATLLKVANSAMFGFRNKVETTKKSVELIGINFTLSIAFGSAIKSNLNTSLDAYGIDADKFLDLSSLSSNLLKTWFKNGDLHLVNGLLLPVFLQDAGQFILADVAKEQGVEAKFLEKIKNDPIIIPKIEKEYFNATSSLVSAMIFEQWNLDDNLVSYIKGVDALENGLKVEDIHARILYIIKILVNPIDPLGDKVVNKALALAKEYGLDYVALEKAISVMEDRILDA